MDLQTSGFAFKSHFRIVEMAGSCLRCSVSEAIEFLPIDLSHDHRCILTATAQRINCFHNRGVDFGW